jgi:glycosyltransferase involved in cell wall biosynthesis
MRCFETAALQRASLAIALTEYDQQDLRLLSGLPNRAIRTITAPFPAQLPTGVEHLVGEPAVVLMDGPWWPIRESTDWFVNEVWPEVRRDLPQAVVHCFGDRQSSNVLEGFVRHPAPSDSSTVFARNAILVVPLRVASGLRMKILESWARGVPVVATPDAAKGLDARDGENLLLASSGKDFARALGRFTVVGSLSESLMRAGRDTLQEHHDPERVGDALVDAYVALSSATSRAGIQSHAARA